MSSNLIVNSEQETNGTHKLLLTYRQVANLRKAFANNLSASIKLSKTQLSKITQLYGFLGRLCNQLLKKTLQLIKRELQRLAKTILIPLGFTAAAASVTAQEYIKNLRPRNCNTNNIK